jgi:copper resistance protein B
MRQVTLAGGLLAVLCLASTPASAQSHDHGAPAPDNDPKLWSQADQYHDPDEMAASRAAVLHEMGDMNQLMVMADRFEIQSADQSDDLVWDGQAWYGGDIDKLWLKTEGHAGLDGGDVDDAEIQALWSRAISPYWDVQAGLRYDVEPDGRAHAVLGLQGLAPYWFEIDAAAFLDDEGKFTARFETEYDLRLTQRLILQPRIEADVAAQDDSARGVGSGVSGFDAGVRLRWEIVREFAPYIGVEWQSSPGRTGDLMEAAGGKREQTMFVAGFRMWR